MSTRVLLLAIFCALAAPVLAQAQVTNGGFETGTLAGWTLTGSGHASDASFGVTPTVGLYDGYIENSGNFTAAAPVVVAALGVPPSAIMALGIGAAPTTGSAISQVVTVSAGDTLTFDWNFLTDELDESAIYNDYAILTIDSAAFLLASRNSSTFNTVSPPAGFDGQTGWHSDFYNFGVGGTHTVGFAVFNVIDGGHNSVLLLDAISLPVPEPGTLVLLGVGVPLLLLARIRGRRLR